MQLAPWSRKSSKHFASNASMSSAGAAKLDTIREYPGAPPLRAGEAAARLEKRRQSMSIIAQSFTNPSLSELVLIDGLVTRQEISHVRFT